MDKDIEHRLTELETKMNLLLTNHMPHLQGTVDKILWWIIGGFTTIFGALLIHGAITYFQVK